MAAAPSDITVVLGKFEEELTCPICREILKEPKSLPCLHSFCQGCLVEYARLRPLGDGGEGEAPPPEARDVIPCPKCKFQAQLDPVGGQGEPGNVVASLKTNHCLKNLVRHYKILQEVVGDRRTKCGFCSVVDNEAVAFCQTGCNQFLCQPCLGSHKRMTLSSDHKMVSLDDVRSNGSLDAENARVAMAYRTRKCGEHFVEGRDDPNERMTDMTIYCFQCSKVICCMCAIIDHQPHNPKKIASSVIDEPDHRPLIKTKVSEAEEVMNKQLYISSIKLHERQFQIEHARSNTEQRIKEDFERLNTGLERERDSLLRRIDNIYQYHLRHLREQRKALDDKRKAIERTLKFVDRRLTLGSAEDVVQFGKEMTRQISQLVGEARENPPEGAYKRVVRFAEEDQNMAGVMGNVSAEPHVEIFTADDIQNVEFVRNEESEFTITARDVLRDEATTDDEMLFIELQPVGQPAEQVVPAEVKKLKNGKCLVTIKPRQTGDHTLSIQVARAGKYQHIHNSPFPVVVAINHAVNLYEV